MLLGAEKISVPHEIKNRGKREKEESERKRRQPFFSPDNHPHLAVFLPQTEQLRTVHSPSTLEISHRPRDCQAETESAALPASH
jgi:hypothetical protein